MRLVEKINAFAEIQTNVSTYIIAIFDARANNGLLSILNLTRTMFVCVILASGAFLFASDAEKVIIGPVKRMIGKLQRIAKNPLEAASIEDKEVVSKEEKLKEIALNIASRRWW